MEWSSFGFSQQQIHRVGDACARNGRKIFAWQWRVATDAGALRTSGYVAWEAGRGSLGARGLPRYFKFAAKYVGRPTIRICRGMLEREEVVSTVTTK